MAPPSPSLSVVADRSGVHRTRPVLRAAFTLVETVLALGVFVFAIVSMLGVMPVALTTLRESAWRQAAGEIVAGVVAEVRSDPEAFVSGSQRSTFPRYFDERGALLACGGDRPARAAFVVAPSSVTTSGIVLDGAPLNSSLRAASFQVSSTLDAGRSLPFQVGLLSL